MVFYTDDVKNSKKINVAMMRFFNVKAKVKNRNLNRYIDLIVAKLFAIEKAIEFCLKQAYSIKIASDI